jgi:hypothetical protein
MKLVQWVIMYDHDSLLSLDSRLPIHPQHSRVLDIMTVCDWIIDLDMKSGCGAWICLRGLFCGKGFSRDADDIDSILHRIGNSVKPFLEISPSDSLDATCVHQLSSLGFVTENNCGLQVMRWYKDEDC